MDELLDCLCKLIKYLVNEVNEKGLKGIIPIIALSILGVMFASPSYLLIFFYKRSLFSEYNGFINIITIIILDVILFLVLFSICSYENIEVDDEGKFVSKGNNLLKDISKTIYLMGLVSVLLVIVKGISVIIRITTKWSIFAKIGVVFLSVILVGILVYRPINLIKKSTKCKANKKLEKMILIDIKRDESIIKNNK